MTEITQLFKEMQARLVNLHSAPQTVEVQIRISELTLCMNRVHELMQESILQAQIPAQEWISTTTA